MAPRAESRSRQIADTLLEAIASAKYPIGSTLPNEHQLCAKFKVSRATVSVALIGASMSEPISGGIK